MDRIAVVAHLKEGAYDEAREVLASGPPVELEGTDLVANTVYCSPREVVFVFEGPNVERFVQSMLNSPVISAQMSVWGHLIDGTPNRAKEAFHWSRSA